MVDYRATNAVTIRNTAPLPRIDALLDRMAGKTVFSSMDLQSGYCQIRIDETDCHKTGFNTPLGHYEFKVLPMGITSAPATFQAVMNKIFGHLDYVMVYLDDILMASGSAAEHIEHLKVVFDVLRANQLSVKLSLSVPSTGQRSSFWDT